MPHSIATFDLTSRCILRCDHCYYFADQPPAGELAAPEFLSRLAALRDHHGIRSALWVGGEPLMRLDLLRLAITLFPRNAVATSGALPVPPDLDAGILVSIDGAAPLHDRLRGSGSFGRAIKNLGQLADRSFNLMVTLTAQTLDAIDQLPALVEQTRAAGALVGFFVGPPGHRLLVSKDDRERAVDRLLGTPTVLNPPAALELFRPREAGRWKKGCIYRTQAIAFDAALERKRPCTWGEERCDDCGCPVIGLQLALAGGDASSARLLSAAFPLRTWAGGPDPRASSSSPT